MSYVIDTSDDVMEPIHAGTQMHWTRGGCGYLYPQLALAKLVTMMDVMNHPIIVRLDSPLGHAYMTTQEGMIGHHYFGDEWRS